MDVNRLYQATNDGLDIITWYLPQATVGKNFSIREGDRHPSAALKQLHGIWRVTDFGDEGRAKSPIDIAMEYERMDFVHTLALLCQRYGVEEVAAAPAPPSIVWKTTKKSDGLYNVKVRPIDSDIALRFWFGSLPRQICEGVLQRYGWEEVVYYERATSGKLMCFMATEQHPVYRRVCTTDDGKYFYKYYQPKEDVRFFYDGEKPAGYVNGYGLLKSAYDERAKQVGDDGDEEQRKLDEVVICSGERDSMCCAALGCLPVWFNSETSKADGKVLSDIERMTKAVYFVPDLDATGQRVGMSTALSHDTWFMVRLPDDLRARCDWRGKPRKDLRDWCDGTGSRRAFRMLLDSACRCRFWHEGLRADNKGNMQLQRVVSTTDFLHFVRCLGFARYIDPKTKEDMFVYIRDNVLSRIDAPGIRSAVTQYIMTGDYNKEIRNLYLNSSRCGVAVLSDLPAISPDMQIVDKDSQAFVFSDVIYKLTSSGCTQQRLADSSTCVFDSTVIRHKLRRIDAQFKADKTGLVEPGCVRSNFFKYLINTSRIYWREELEEPDLQPSRDYWAKKSGQPYETAYRYCIDGPALTPEQKAVQRLNLSSKIFAIGYLLHSYKTSSRPWAVWAMENHVDDETQSSGGTGKSFFFRALSKLLPTLTINGSERDFTSDRALFDRYDATTRMIYVDEAPANIDLRYFYNMITGDMVVKRKYQASAVVGYEDSPKFAFSSNFPPPNLDPSTMRRFLFLLFSDYYHHKSEDNDYKQTRTIADDFDGRDICTGEYSPEDWSADYNFFLDCLQYYLLQVSLGRKIEPDMEGLFKRVHERAMGPQLRDWADVYLSPSAGNLNRRISKTDVLDNYREQSGNYKMSSCRFKKLLRIYCREEGIDFNPHNIDGYDSAHDRIVSRMDVNTRDGIKSQTVECFYFAK